MEEGREVNQELDDGELGLKTETLKTERITARLVVMDLQGLRGV